MAIEVAKVELKSVSDASGMEERIKAGQFTADQVIAVIGKTEGNGGVNDFTRILADQVFRRVLMKHGKRSEVDVGKVPMVWSGGCDGVITPHATVFARDDRKGPASKSRLTIGTAMSATLLPKTSVALRWSRRSRTRCGRRCATPASAIPRMCIMCKPRRRC